MGAAEEAIPDFVEPRITFSSGQTYEILEPLNDYRSCHDGTPQEARMVFTCRRVGSEPSSEVLIMKTKTQLPSEGQDPHPGPSTTTAHELKALTAFRDAKTDFAPHLVDFHTKIQDKRGPLPGGFMTFTVMTKMPGFALFGKYWNMSDQERDEIMPKAIEALRAIYSLGIEPADRGMRNVMWEPETRSCRIIDFELWNETSTTFADEKTEMRRWGLLRTPVAKNHYEAFNAMYRS